MAFNYNKLKGRIVEVFGTQGQFAKAMNWSERTLSLKLNGNRTWRQDDICKAINLLGLSEGDIQLYFFTPEVQNIELSE
jgi:hypothetical protein